MKVYKMVAGLISGCLFGFGLAASGMTDRAKVLGFLDLFGNWDPDLLFVMGSAVVTTLILFRIALSRQTPWFDKQFFLPSSTLIDKRLIVGASLFGLGWGLYGYCPGPAISSLIYLELPTVLFVAAMLVGMLVAQRLTKF
jgi:uncharacterized membrane protein YedE/YeeE